MYFTSSVTSKGQITIPYQLRQALKINQNQQVIFQLKKNCIEIKPSTMKLKDTFAILKNKQKNNFKKLSQKAIKEKVNNFKNKFLKNE